MGERLDRRAAIAVLTEDRRGQAEQLVTATIETGLECRIEREPGHARPVGGSLAAVGSGIDHSVLCARPPHTAARARDGRAGRLMPPVWLYDLIYRRRAPGRWGPGPSSSGSWMAASSRPIGWPRGARSTSAAAPARTPSSSPRRASMSLASTSRRSPSGRRIGRRLSRGVRATPPGPRRPHGDAHPRRRRPVRPARRLRHARRPVAAGTRGDGRDDRPPVSSGLRAGHVRVLRGASRPARFSLSGPSRVAPALEPGEEVALFGEAFDIERLREPRPEELAAVFVMTRRDGGARPE